MSLVVGIVGYGIVGFAGAQDAEGGDHLVVMQRASERAIEHAAVERSRVQAVYAGGVSVAASSTAAALAVALELSPLCHAADLSAGAHTAAEVLFGVANLVRTSAAEYGLAIHVCLCEGRLCATALILGRKPSEVLATLDREVTVRGAPQYDKHSTAALVAGGAIRQLLSRRRLAPADIDHVAVCGVADPAAACHAAGFAPRQYRAGLKHADGSCACALPQLIAQLIVDSRADARLLAAAASAEGGDAFLLTRTAVGGAVNESTGGDGAGWVTTDR